MNTHLLIHNFLYLFSIVLSFSLILLLFFKVKNNTEKNTLILALLGAMIFVGSHVLGVSVADGELSRRILMFNLVDIFIPIFTGHCVLAFINKAKEQKYFIIASYVLGFGLLSFFLINPHNFLLTSVPKMYFPNYYVAGDYYFLMLILFFFLIGYVFVIMARTYVVSDFVNKNRIKYFALALFLGYSVGSINFLLIYNILIDPMWGVFFIPLFAIPFTYAIVHYELMDIKIIAKKAFIYISVSVIISFTLISLNYLNSLIIKSTTKFPVWGSSFILSFIATVFLVFLWKKLRETDFLKYEFINIITHKFRTPLTAIKWASDNLNESIVPENLKEDIYTIQASSKNLVDLTNILTRLATTDNNIFEYVFVKVDLNKEIKDIFLEYQYKIKRKGIVIDQPKDGNNFVLADKEKLKFVLQTLIFNAINYNKVDGTISVFISKTDDGYMVLEIKDTGIGIDKREIPFIFTKFYRTDSSRRADTEGMGIGLFLAKNIIEKHGGKIWVDSEGLEKGSSFFVKLPIYRDKI